MISVIPVRERETIMNLSLADQPEPLQKLFLFVSRAVSKGKLTVESIDHKDYAEHYHISSESGERCHAIFYYNKQYEFKKFSIVRAEPDELRNEVMRLIKDYRPHRSDNKDSSVEQIVYPSNIVGDMLKEMDKSVMDYNITGIEFTEHSYITRAEFKRKDEYLVLDVYYNKDGFITIITPNKSNSAQLHDDVKAIFMNFIQGYK